MNVRSSLWLVLVTLLITPALHAQNTPVAAQKLGRERKAVAVQPDGLYICEAEEFQSAGPADKSGGWQAKRFGENYYAATFANSFLSRQAFLGAPEQCEYAAAEIHVDIKEAGRYLTLVRYEAAYRFETQFRVQVEQNGKLVLNRLYGARNNLKIWAFRQKLKKEIGWSWGAVENIVWEGHDAFATLKPGRATIRLIAVKQPEPAAKRNIDLVMLTTDVAQVKSRIEKENYLPLDGMLTQSGDVFLRVTNLGGQPLAFVGGKATGGGNWQQHSPYWVHIRNWKAPSVMVEPGKTSQWVEVGGTMDSLSDGQWYWTGNGKYRAEFGLREANGSISKLAEFTGEGALKLAADGDTRYSRRLRRQEDVLYDLLADLKKTDPARHGRAPQRTPIYASTFDALDSGKHAAAVVEFKKLFALSDTKPDASGGRGYIDVRSVATPKLEAYCKALAANAKNVAVVSLGDEIRLPTPRGKDVNDAFRQWLKSRGVKPSDVVPSAGLNWNAITWSLDAKLKESNPGVFYWSKRYQYDFGIKTIKQRTDILRKHFPNAGVGANYSPHYPQEHMFLGEVFKWVTVFRDSGMTLPWSEDYIWQVSVGTPQMNNINFDLFRAALRHHPDRKIMYYVMPHMPNNTPRQWRRLFYGAIGHGMKIVDLFEFRPVHVAYTENHVDEPEMYREVLKSFRELGTYEDIVQDGRVQFAEAALWFSETADIWGDSHGSFAAAKRGLYTAIRHQQIPLDFVVEQDALDGTLAKYKVLYLTDAHVSQAASMSIADWVASGGQLFATAGAGMFDELNRPNEALRKVLGVSQTKLEAPQGKQLIWLKQDLPFAAPITKAEKTDCRALCVAPNGTVWAGVAATFKGRGQFLHLVSRRPKDKAPTDRGPIAIQNPMYTTFTEANGKVKKYHHGVYKLKDGKLLPRYVIMGICAASDGTVYVTTLYPFTVHAIRVPKVAGLTTEYRHNSHADVILTRLLKTDTLDGKGRTPPLELVSIHTDQVPAIDTSRKLAAENGVRISKSINEALTLGANQLAVDGVLLIAEHGKYPESDTGQFQFPKRRMFAEVVETFRRAVRHNILEFSRENSPFSRTVI